MIVLLFSLLCGAVLASEHHSLPSKSIEKDKDTVLILFGTRHGNRHPENFLTENPRTYGQEGQLELTNFGKRQALGLGRELRHFMGDKFVSYNFLPKEAKYYSSSANRCQMTLQAALAGLHRPEEWGEWEKQTFDNWTPVPYSIEDPLLRMYSVPNCPESDKAWKPVSDDTWEPLKKQLKEKKKILDYINKNTGWKPSLSVAADVADNLIEIELYNASYPAWIEKPTLPGYDKKKMLAELLSFAEAHQNACTEYGPCKKLMGGYWTKHIIDSIKKAHSGEGPKLIGYAGHTETTLALMKLIGISKDELTTSAGFVVEFKVSNDCLPWVKPTPAVRLLNHDPNPIDKHVIYKADLAKELQKDAGKDGWIPLAKWLKYAEKNQIIDWESACGRKVCK